MNKNTWKTFALALTLASVEANATIEESDFLVSVQDNIGKFSPNIYKAFSMTGLISDSITR